MKTLAELLAERDALLAILDDENATDEARSDAAGKVDDLAARIDAARKLEQTIAGMRSVTPVAPVTPAGPVVNRDNNGADTGQTRQDRPVSARERGRQNVTATLTRIADAKPSKANKVREAGVSGMARTLLFGTGETRAAITTADLGRPAEWGGIHAAPRGKTRFLDLLPTRFVTGSTLQYLQEDATANAAAETAEAAVKPEQEFSWTPVEEVWPTIAVWTAITEQAAQDYTELQATVEGSLASRVRSRLNQQAATGDGIAPNISGLLTRTGTGTYTAGAGEAKWQSVMAAITQHQQAGYNPGVVLVNPADLAEIRFTNIGGAFPFLSLDGFDAELIPFAAVTAGEFVVLDPSDENVELLIRDDVDIAVGLVDDQFIRNEFTVRAEMRAGLALYRSLAVVKGTFAAA